MSQNGGKIIEKFPKIILQIKIIQFLNNIFFCKINKNQKHEKYRILITKTHKKNQHEALLHNALAYEEFLKLAPPARNKQGDLLNTNIWSHPNSTYSSLWSHLDWVHCFVWSSLNSRYGSEWFHLSFFTQYDPTKFQQLGISVVLLLLCK